MSGRPKIMNTSFVLAVPDIAEAERFWCDVLGFKVQQEPDGWCFVARDNCRVMMGECPDAIAPGALGDHSYFAYIILDDIAAYHAEIAPRGAEILAGPADQPWGMREMAVRTPDGHRIMFGEELG